MRHQNKYADLAPEPPYVPSLASKHKEKVKYPSLSVARRAQEKMEEKTGETFDVYLCPVCGRYHIGHQRPTSGA